MGSISAETKLTVKHTFLEIVVDDPQFPADSRKRSFTDGSIMSPSFMCLGQQDGEVRSNVSTADAYAQAAFQQKSEQSRSGHATPGGNAPLERQTPPGPAMKPLDRLTQAFNERPTPAYNVDFSAENARLARENADLQAYAASASASAASAATPQNTTWAKTTGVQGKVATGGVDAGQQILAMMAAGTPMGSPGTWFIPMMPVQSLNQNQSQSQSQSNAREAPISSGYPLAPQQQRSAPAPPPPRAQAQGAPLKLANRLPKTTTSSSDEEFTTLMLRNLPNQYTRDMFVEMLNFEGFAGKFNFVYLPVDFKTHAGLGYAFVDLINPQETNRMRQHFEGFSRWTVRSEKVCSVSWSHPEQQGLATHVERYRNSPVMHSCVPDPWKPALFNGGQRVPFPAPTRKLRNPHIRNL